MNSAVVFALLAIAASASAGVLAPAVVGPAPLAYAAPYAAPFAAPIGYAAPFGVAKAVAAPVAFGAPVAKAVGPVAYFG